MPEEKITALRSQLSKVIYSDTSATGYGGFTVEHGCHITHSAWSDDQAAKNSSWREHGWCWNLSFPS